jgi:hypothetical protein
MFKKNVKKGMYLSAVLAAAVLLNGCASMFGDNTRTITVTSQPQGAEIFVESISYGTTPATITLPGYIYGGKILVLRKEGFKDQAILVNSKFQPVTIWNILNGFGFLIDAATGDILKIDPMNLNTSANLAPVKSNK